MKITIIAGARPNFIKIAPIINAIQNRPRKDIDYRLVHTGQHYDSKMSDTFFKELNISEPDNNLGCGGGTQAEQTAAIMVAFEKELTENSTDLVLVVGDVTSTMACSIVAKKLNVKVAHVEAGIRSGDITMPEEVNRLVTDSIADYFFTTTQWATDNLIKSGVSSDRIFWVGNVMIDTLLFNLNRLRKPDFWDNFSLKNGGYFVLTVHRPSNVDEAVKFQNLVSAISESVGDKRVIFPIHPRSRKIFQELGVNFENITVTDPLGYLEFNYLVKNSVGVITDSGGITEETTVMGIPCVTLRENTERPETVELGTNELIGMDILKLRKAVKSIVNKEWKSGSIPEKWDGNSAERIVKVLITLQD